MRVKLSSERIQLQHKLIFILHETKAFSCHYIDNYQMLDLFLKFDQVLVPTQLYGVCDYWVHIPSSLVRIMARHGRYLHMVTN